MKLLVILVLVLVIAILFCAYKKGGLCGVIDGYGQDASIRAGMAGPHDIYGYSPSQQFAEQIEELRERQVRAQKGKCAKGSCD